MRALALIKGPPPPSLRGPGARCIDRRALLRLCWFILALMAAILAPTCRNIGPKCAPRCDLGVNMVQNSSQDAHQATPSTPKYTKTIKTQRFSLLLLPGPYAKIAPKSTPNRPQIDPRGAILGTIAPSCRQHGPT